MSADHSGAPAPWNESPAVDARVEELLAQLTPAEKVLLVTDGGNQPAANDPLPRRGLPLLRLADGPAGVRLNAQHPAAGQVTALPAPIGLAAAWDPALARRYGDLIGAEMVATGHTILLGPAVDTVRTPLAGRTFESFGEDPLLQARLVVAEIDAVQAHGVQVCIKHYLVNNKETQRSTIDVQVDERTLQEIYLPAYGAAIQQAGVAAVMASYNRLRGLYACEQPHLLTAILREQLGFRGWVMSDFMATQSTAASANAGLDYELGPRWWGDKLLAAVQQGDVAPEQLDEMVRRILRPLVGITEAAQPAAAVVTLPAPAHAQVAREIAEQTLVLLKNTGDLLPLRADELKAIAVIGVDAAGFRTAGGGSAHVTAGQGAGLLDALRRRLGDAVRVEYAAGVAPVGPSAQMPGLDPIPPDYLRFGEAEGQSGLQASYWHNADFAGEPALTRREPRPELHHGFLDMIGSSVASPGWLPLPADLPRPFAVRWQGELTAPLTGEYQFSLSVLGSARLFVDGRLVLDSATMRPVQVLHHRLFPHEIWPVAEERGLRVFAAPVLLDAGRPCAVTVEYQTDAPGPWIFREVMLRLGWQPPRPVITPSMAAAADLARTADVAIVAVRTFESEEMDRPDLALPNEQAALIRAVAAANPRTIVLVMSGGPVEMAGWEEQTPAVVQCWFGGQEWGAAVARLLVGDVAPSGKLPLTIPLSAAQTPLRTPEQYPGVAGRLEYSERLAVGYRGYDQLGLPVQYPFGHGLTYTRFAYRNLAVTSIAAAAGETVHVEFSVENSGRRAGVEIAQIYVEFPPEAGEPPHRLAGWVRCALEPGEERALAVTLARNSPEHLFDIWDETEHGWRGVSGDYRIFVGPSSRDLPLSAPLRLA